MPAALLGAAGILSPAAAESTGFDVRANYEKSEHRVTMRDGIELHTVIYRPRDRSRQYPILLNRTPYSAGPYGDGNYRSVLAMAPSEEFLRAGYIFVFQDARGTYRSGGEWVDFRPPLKDRGQQGAIDEGTDNFDTIEWLVRNVEGHNGKVGQWGISYPGWYTVMGLLEPHPALAAVSPQATTGDPFIGDDYHHNGAFMLVNLGFLEGMTVTTGPGREQLATGPVPSGIGLDERWAYDFYLNAGPTSEIDAKYFDGRLMAGWKALIEHPDYDSYWQDRDFVNAIDRVRIPVLNVAGWFDAPDPYGAIATYRRIEQREPRNSSSLVIGPWRHGGWHDDESQGARLGEIEFGSKTAEWYQQNVVFPFFEFHLKGAGRAPSDEAIVFETGANRWHRLPQWPPRQVDPRSLYLRADSALSFEPPADGDAPAADSYVSSPSKPVPDGPFPDTEHFTIADQRYAFTRPDVLSFRSPVLTEDLTIAGPIPIELYASTTGEDADYFVKLIDEYPAEAAEMAGHQMLLAYEVMRARYRNSFSDPEPMRPGEVTAIRFELRDRFHTFRKGHRIMVQVHSSWFPAFDRNPQTWVENIYRAKPGDYRDATQTIHWLPSTPSRLILPVLAPDSVPR